MVKRYLHSNRLNSYSVLIKDSFALLFAFKANELLVRTLLSYCSVHGSQGGGLASVRMELILLLQELQQDRRFTTGRSHFIIFGAQKNFNVIVLQEVQNRHRT